VGGGQPRAVRPLHVPRDVERECLVAVRPRPGAGEPRDGPASARGRDDQRLVERPLRDRGGGKPTACKGIEVSGEGGDAGAGHDEAAVSGRGRCRGRLLRGPRAGALHEQRDADGTGETESAGRPEAEGDGASWALHVSFLSFGSDGEPTLTHVPGTVNR